MKLERISAILVLAFCTAIVAATTGATAAIFTVYMLVDVMGIGIDTINGVLQVFFGGAAAIVSAVSATGWIGICISDSFHRRWRDEDAKIK